MIVNLIRRALRYARARVNCFRVTRGFTVHSPFAYRFITRVLRERLPYYHFRSEVTDPTERLLYRVAVHFNPPTVCCIGSHAERAREVIGLALPRAEFTERPEEARFVYCGQTEGNLPEGSPVLFTTGFSPGQWQRLQQGAPMTFTDGHIGIAVCRQRLPRQHFYVKLPLKARRLR